MLGLKSFAGRHKRGLTLLTLVLVSIVLIVISNKNLETKPKEVGQSLVYTFQVALSKTAGWFRDRWNSISELKRVRQELGQARQRLSEYERESRDITELKQENAHLRQQLAFSESSASEQIPAEVIARDPGNVFSAITLNRGSRHGVTRNMPVVAFQDGQEGLVGVVSYVGRRSAVVRPLFDPQCYVAARLQTTRYEGLVSGNGDYLMMQYVSKESKDGMAYGDLVITSGLGGVFPGGIPIGRISTFKAKPYETSMELELVPIIDFSRLEYVFILRTRDDL